MRLPEPFDDVPVRFATIGPEVDALPELSPRLRATDDTVFYQYGPVGVLVEGTSQVTIDVDRPMPEDFDVSVLADLDVDDVVRSFTVGAIPRMLFLHSGVFCLHGSLLDVDGCHVVVCGHSTAGKSTTVSYLWRHHGARVLVDDVVPVSVVDARAIARPYSRPVTLLDDAVDRIGLERDDLELVSLGHRFKFVLDMATPAGPVPIDLMVVLVRGEEGSPPIDVVHLAGAERLRRVVRASNVVGLSSLGRRWASFFTWSTGVASACPVVEITRHPDLDTLAEVASTIIGLAASASADRAGTVGP